MFIRLLTVGIMGYHFIFMCSSDHMKEEISVKLCSSKRKIETCLQGNSPFCAISKVAVFMNYIKKMISPVLKMGTHKVKSLTSLASSKEISSPLKVIP